MTKFQILYWHDIPVQVKARGEDGRVSKQLAGRFMEAVDEAAMAARQTEDSKYTAGFKWTKAEEREGTVQQVVEAVAAEIEAQYPVIDWRKTADALKAGQL